MFSYISPEQRARKDHPLRLIRAMSGLQGTQGTLARSSPRCIPKRVVRRFRRSSCCALCCCRCLCTPVRSERLLVEEIDYKYICFAGSWG